jgi:hypothetical protein
MRIEILQRLVRHSVPVAGFSLLLVAGIALAQQNVPPPQLKAVPEETPNDPYLKSESGDKASPRTQAPLKGETPRVEEWRDEAQKLLDSLGKMLKSIPTYETPTVDENGDIIIRRRPPDAKPEAPKSSPDGKTYGT